MIKIPSMQRGDIVRDYSSKVTQLTKALWDPTVIYGVSCISGGAVPTDIRPSLPRFGLRFTGRNGACEIASYGLHQQLTEYVSHTSGLPRAPQT